MNQIQEIRKTRLDNAYHNAFIDQVLILANEQDFHEPKIAEATAALQDAFTREDENFKIPQASELSPQIAAADNARREGYIHLKTIVNDWAKTPYTPQGPSARKIKKVLDKYNLKSRIMIDRRSGILTNIVAELSEEENLQALDDLRLKEVLGHIRVNNNTVLTLTVARSGERALAEKGALKKARRATDRAYEAWATLINGYVAISDDPAPYETLINQVNELIDDIRIKLKQQASRKATLKKKKENASQEEQEPSGEPTPSPMN